MLGSESVVGRIAKLIRDQGLQPGDRLPSIRALADQLGASVNVVRDSLLVAQTQGMVRVLPRAGAFVEQPISEQPSTSATDSAASPGHSFSARSATDGCNLFHLLDARRTIEVELVGRAARARRLEDLEPIRRTLGQMAQIPQLERRESYLALDIRFHSQVAHLGRNEVLANFLTELLVQLRPHLQRLPWTVDRRSQTDESHTAIYQALVQGDEAKIKQHTEAHLQVAYEHLLQQVCQSPLLGSESGQASAT